MAPPTKKGRPRKRRKPTGGNASDAPSVETAGAGASTPATGGGAATTTVAPPPRKKVKTAAQKKKGDAMMSYMLERVSLIETRACACACGGCGCGCS